jgi:glycine/D-amino acid oxidase-like deaminating enzyme
VISATNGYTSNENPALRKRLLSVRLYMAVTQPMPAEIRGKLFPTPRQFVDSKISMNWIRPSQDGGRLLIGGRGGMLGNDPVKHAQILHADMVKMIPELAPLKITHSWHGLIDFSHDFAPHIGQMDGIYYAAGYCGVGMALGTYLGTKLANKILGARGELAATAIDSLKFPKEPMLGPFRDLYAQLGSKYMELRDWWDLRER